MLRFVPRMAPIKAAIFPLLKKNGEQVRIAREIEKTLQPWMSVFFMMKREPSAAVTVVRMKWVLLSV